MSEKDLSKWIVVGVDGSEDGERALRWALETAQRRDLSILLVHGLDVGLSAADPYGGGYVLEQLQDAGRLALEAASKMCADAGIECESKLEMGSPGYLLVEESRGAAMLVIGSRGHGGFVGLLLGSVSNACVHHAHCPVVVVPPPERTDR
ncbi:MAG: universal stress protein [Acidimicrobiaceae bacterium]|nr:universal stress protein [Ilumatobacter sp.]MCB9380816.1 universal stress protein [Acidimicrobiaceae bacterium]MCO5329905.1 universal stress protein [Ilumatobacteraceae bacterium]